MINGKTPRVGDTLVLRCGGRVVCTSYYDEHDAPICVADERWYSRGNFHISGEHPLDIIDIEPAPDPVVRYLIQSKHATSAVICADKHSEAYQGFDLHNIYKVTLIDGSDPKIERVKR